MGEAEARGAVGSVQATDSLLLVLEGYQVVYSGVYLVKIVVYSLTEGNS